MSIPSLYPGLAATADTVQGLFPPSDDITEEEAMKAMFSVKKKKKKKISSSAPEEVSEGQNPADAEPDESYEDLLSRIYTAMGVKQDESGIVRIKPPKTEQVGSKKTAWLNFRVTCATLNRSEEHVNLFVSSELGILTSVTEGGALLLRGIFPGQKLEGLIRKYMENYVKCPMCRASKTMLRKDPDSRLMMLDCSVCKASRCVAAIQSGFHATTKSDRKKAAREEE